MKINYMLFLLFVPGKQNKVQQNCEFKPLHFERLKPKTITDKLQFHCHTHMQCFALILLGITNQIILTHSYLSLLYKHL